MCTDVLENNNANKPIHLSIIIVSWNACKHLLECIESIVAARIFCRYEIIVVDNNSTDGSPEMVSELFPTIVLIRNDDNLGFAKANNIGIKRALGDYVCLVNSDVVVAPGCFDSMIECMDSDPSIGLLGPQIVGVDGAVQRSCMGFPTLTNMFFRSLGLDTLFPGSQLFGNYLMTFWNHNTKREVDIINGCFWLTHKKSLDTVGLLDERFFIYGEDMDWCKRFRDNGWKVYFFPDVQAVHVGGASSANAPLRFYIEQYRANFQYWEKHHNTLSVIFYYILLFVHNIVRSVVYAVQFVLFASKRNIALYKMKRSFACILFLMRINGLSN